MLPRADFVVYDRNGQPSIAVEVKRKLRTTPRWATEFHRNLIAHGPSTPLDYFTIVTPDRLYVWDEDAAEDASPTYDLPAASALEPYFRGTGFDPESVSGEAFETIVRWWLNDLVDPFRTGTVRIEGISNLIDRVKGGRVEPEAAA